MMFFSVMMMVVIRNHNSALVAKYNEIYNILRFTLVVKGLGYNYTHEQLHDF